MLTAFLVLAALLGLIIGSFLNVVIYRLPRELSVSQPRWSFCPACNHTLVAHDNVPVLSWLLLRGRCRYCHAPIALQYPLIELMTAIVFVAIFDAMLIGRVQTAMTGGAADAVPVIALWSLFACLLASAVIDLENYIIDLRLTNFAMIVGVLAQTVWGPLQPRANALPDMRLAAAAVTMALAWLATLWVLRRRYRDEPAPTNESPISDESPPAPFTPQIAPGGSAAPADSAPRLPDASQPGATTPNDADDPRASDAFTISTAEIIAIVILTLTLVALVAATRFAPAPANGAINMPFAIRAIATLAVLCFVLILAAMQPRPADDHMIATLEQERPRARAVARDEFKWLLPALLAGIAAWWLTGLAGRRHDWTDLFGPVPPVHGRLLAGAAAGLTGLMGGAVLGWAVRILFTLLFGKEAFGTGDIHILAAIGAVGGFWLALVAFFIAPVLALFGVVASMTRKNWRALPYGPWLALGALVALWIREPVATMLINAWTTFRTFTTTGR